MAKITIQHAHHLGQDGAIRKLKSMESAMASEYGLSTSWRGHALYVKRSGVSGTIEVQHQQVRVDLDVSWWLGAFSGTIESGVRKMLREYF